jgi:hypothetical protein
MTDLARRPPAATVSPSRAIRWRRTTFLYAAMPGRSAGRRPVVMRGRMTESGRRPRPCGHDRLPRPRRPLVDSNATHAVRASQPADLEPARAEGAA